ncbi:hypothetical protein [Haloprofundus halobius]|uniref:hypothetical protein n=1 Tax=Haloprofundus halobius TaxID=2876194 RepID=UPI001CCF0E61|nr:hypothetical protein [Haloprofundus halobius]
MDESSSIPSYLVDEVLFSEPSGWVHASVQFASALLFTGIYVYFGVLGDVPFDPALFLAVAASLSSLAESLPKERRRTAGMLRVLGILVALALIALVLLAPEHVLPR